MLVKTRISGGVCVFVGLGVADVSATKTDATNLSHEVTVSRACIRSDSEDERSCGSRLHQINTVLPLTQSYCEVCKRASTPTVKMFYF